MGYRRALLFGLAAASCGDEPFVGDVSRSRYFEYHDQVTESLCPTLLADLDSHAQMIGSKVGLKLVDNDRYRYYKFRDAAAFAQDTGGCPPEGGACALGDAIYADTYFHAHEQAHDYVYRAWGGWSDGLLDEGEAVALSCLPSYQLEPTQSPTDVVGPLAWRDLVNLYGKSVEGYGAAGFFVTYLAETYGWQSVEALHRKVSRGSSADDLQKAFAEVFPTSIDDAWATAQSAAGAPPCERDWQCVATAMSVGETAIPDCDGEMHRSVDVNAQGGVVLSVQGDNAELVLMTCDAAPQTSFALDSRLVGLPTTHWASLPPGSYTMFPGTAALPSSVTLGSAFAGPLVAASCGSATVVSLDPAGSTSADLAAGAVTGWMRVAGGGRTYSVASYNLFSNNGGTTAISICTDCSASSCVPLADGQATQVVIGDQAVVQFAGAISIPSPSEAWGQLFFDVVP